MKKDFELKGIIYNNSEKEPFYLRISEPIKSEGEDDFYCRIHCPYLFKREKSILGVNEEQAFELALDFVCNLLGDKEVFNDKGEEIDFKKIRIAH